MITYYYVCIVRLRVASYPGPSFQEEVEEKGPSTHCARMRRGLHSDQSRYHSDCSRVCMTCSSMDDKQRVYDGIRLPQFLFLGSPGACACNAYQALSPPPPEGPGYKARLKARLKGALSAKL
jgi:hypothetical protein